MIAAIDHRRAIRIIFDNHFRLFHQSLKKLPVVERLFWQLGTRYSGRCGEVASVGLNKSQCMDCPPGQKKVAIFVRRRWPLLEVRL